MNLLITGCNGLIGKNLTKLLSQNSFYQLTGIARGRNDLINAIGIDLSEDWNTSLLPQQIDAVIHLAQSEHFRNFPAKALDIFNVNIASTARLADYAVNAGAKKFIFASSGGIYGNRDKVFEEEDALPVNDLGYYLGSKLCSEIILDNYKNLLDVQLLRFFFAYGPGQNKSMLIPRLIEKIRNNEPIELSGEEGIRLNPIFAEDAARAIIASIKVEGSNHINIAGNEIFSLRELCNLIGEKMGKQPAFEVRSSKSQNLVADISRMKKLLVPPQITFKQALEELIK
jgi:nucleoside-diphosphate-sugar epimerase